MLRMALASSALALTASALYPPSRFGWWVLLGRGHNCDFSRAWRSPQELSEQTRLKDEILVASRLLETDRAGYKLYDTPMGRFWIPEGSDYMLPFNLAEMKREIYFSGNHRVRPGDVVLDCGANVGVFARRALEMGAATVVAVEPGPENLECLRRNFSSEIATGRVLVVAKGVWSRTDLLEFHIDPENSAADSLLIRRPGSRAIRVPVTTIDELCRELGLTRIDFLKMDIEGAELEAIEGGAATIRKYKPRISVASYHFSHHPEEIPARIRALRADYRMSCGTCAEVLFGVRPDVLYFQ